MLNIILSLILLYFYYNKGDKMFKNILKNKSYLLIAIFLTLSACDGTSGTNVTVAGTKKDAPKINSSQEELLNAINKARSESRDCYPNDPNRGKVGPVPPLYWDNELYASALEHSTDLAFSNTFSHYGSGTKYDITGDGSPSTFYERIVANGYSNYYSVGENIAGGQESIEEVMEAWLKSPGHCANIMSDKYTDIGVAIITKEDSTYGIYWTQNFGSKHQ
jgi:uncharacterized protein YkwD